MSTDDQTDRNAVQRNRPENVDALASTVISVLRDRQVISSEGLRQFVLDHMLRAVLHKGAFSADDLLLELRGYRLSADAVIDLYVPKTARTLGELWVDDRINFAQVTIGIMRLQAVLAEAASVALNETVPSALNLHALIIVPQGEQHFLGASVLACQIRRMGAEVDISFDEDMGTLSARLMQDIPDLILISCARLETLETVAKTVQTIRGVVSGGSTIALGGAVKVERDVVIEMTNVDIVTDRAEEAIALCQSRALPRKQG